MYYVLVLSVHMPQDRSGRLETHSVSVLPR